MYRHHKQCGIMSKLVMASIINVISLQYFQDEKKKCWFLHRRHQYLNNTFSWWGRPNIRFPINNQSGKRSSQSVPTCPGCPQLTGPLSRSPVATVSLSSLLSVWFSATPAAAPRSAVNAVPHVSVGEIRLGWASAKAVKHGLKQASRKYSPSLFCSAAALFVRCGFLGHTGY